MGANLLVGLEYFLRFACHARVLTDHEFEVLWKRGAISIQQAASDQQHHQATNDPVKQFLKFVRSAINAGDAHVAALDGQAPEQAERWGWRAAPRADLSNGVKDSRRA